MLAAVADGVGGTGGGKLASACAVETLLAEIWMTDADDPARTLQDAFAAADRAVRAKAEQLGLQGMATTLVAAVVRDGTAWIANAGDSRAYLYRDGALAQLTEDHSWVAEQVRVGRMTAEEASESSFRNIITRAVGAGESARPDTLGPIELPAGTLLLLCSDGLHGVVSGDAIAAALARGGAPGEMADRLVEMANESGGPDNVSAVIVRG
jgi:protein phosphatase